MCLRAEVVGHAVEDDLVLGVRHEPTTLSQGATFYADAWYFGTAMTFSSAMAPVAGTARRPVLEWERAWACAGILTLLGCSPMQMTHGVPNFERVSAGVLRGGEPNAEGWKWLKEEQGVSTVVKLNYESEGSDQRATNLGLNVIVSSIQPAGLDGMSPAALVKAVSETRVVPSDESIANAVRAMISSKGTVYVHCTHGQDRTGLVVGVYRVLHDGRGKDESYQEMLSHHFHPELHGLHEFWERFDVARWQAESASWK